MHITTIASIMIWIEIISFIFAPVLMGKPRTGTYNWSWWFANSIQSLVVILLALRVLGKI